MNKQLYVAKTGSNDHDGSEESPFLTISYAAKIAQPGDTITVHEGTYREWVKPETSGLDHKRCITYQAAPGEKVIIKGSEEIKSWEPDRDNVWKVTIPESFFNGYNPYREEVFGDWLQRDEHKKHVGDVYLNGMSFYEATSLSAVYEAKERVLVKDNWTQIDNSVVNLYQTKYLWYAEVTSEQTTIYANFHGANPNEEFVEINVRQSCFSPIKTAINYITLRGFEICHAASPWTPPTSNQIGMVGPNWSKGWVIEDNILHDAKCSAISIGKEESTGHNHHSIRFDKTAHQYQLESVFRALQIGWKNETVGSHIIRNNTIYDCGQNGIVGHLGCINSVIENNHIYNIALKREFYGHEIGGIKLHAPIDVEIVGNYIHDCSLGTWLDWQTQGTRIHRNIYHSNSRDFFVEVSHGPFIVDHNIFGSSSEFDNFAQGGAYLHNLFCGHFRIESVLDRATPYHFPHSTEAAGYSFVYSGDDRFINNLFVHGSNQEIPVGTEGFNGYPESFEAYQTLARSDYRGLWEAVQHVTIHDNAYLNGATSYESEKDAVVLPEFDPQISLEKEVDGLYLSITLPENTSFDREIVSSSSLGHARIVGAPFDAKDGSTIVFNIDLLGEEKSDHATIGPIQNLKSGPNRFKLWSNK